MKNNKKIWIKSIAVGMLTTLLGVFTQCVANNTSQVGGNPSKNTYVSTPTDPVGTGGNTLADAQATVGLKSHEQILHTMSSLTGVAPSIASVQTAYNQLATTLPTDNDPKVFMPPQQLAITKLAAEFCHVMVDVTELRSVVFPGYNFNAPATTGLTQQNRDFLIDQLITHFWGDMITQDERVVAEDSFNILINDLLMGENLNNSATTRNVVKAMCTTALSSAHVTFI